MSNLCRIKYVARALTSRAFLLNYVQNFNPKYGYLGRIDHNKSLNNYIDQSDLFKNGSNTFL